MNHQMHPFEQAGMGIGPFSFVGMAEMPDLSESSASNFASLDPYAEIRSLNLKSGAGTCSCCGMAISIICVVENGVGERYGVGSDCVLKCGQPALCNAAKVAVAKRRNEINRKRNEARREQQHQKWLATASTKVDALPGETNGQYLDRQNARIAELEAKRQASIASRANAFSDILNALFAADSDFHRSLAEQLKFGPLSERQAAFVGKLFPKSDRNAVIDRCVQS